MHPNIPLTRRIVKRAAQAAAGILLLNLPAWSQDATAPSGDIVQLDAFSVTTTIGSYHEETSSTASKIPMDLKDIAGSLQILNASALGDRGALKLQNVYTYIVGMSQAQTNANGFTFRGFANTGSFTQNVQYDGLQGGVSQKGALSAVDVQSVEFLKGPNSVLYGQMHPGGLLNIVTKSPQQTAHVTLTGEYATFAGKGSSPGDKNNWIGIADITGPIDDGKHLLYRVVASDQSLTPFRQGDFERDNFIYPSLTYRWSADTSLTVKLEVVYLRRRQDDGLVPIFTQGITYGPAARYTLAARDIVYQEPTDTGVDKGQAYSAFFQTRFADNWTLRVADRTVYHRDITRELTQQSQTVVVTNPLQNSVIARNYNNFDNAHRYSYFDANIYGKIGPKSFENTILLGVGGGVESFDNHRLGNGPKVPVINVFTPQLGVTAYPADGTKPSDIKQYLSNLGEYVSDVMQIGENLHISLGTRHDQQATHGIDTINPTVSGQPYVHQFVTAQTSQLGVVYALSKQWSTYASASQSFVPNSVTQLDANGNSGFAPEKGYQYEGGVKFQTLDHRLFVSADAYFINRNNVVVLTSLTLPNGQGINRIDGEQHSEGVEFEGEWHPYPYWQLQGGVALGKAFIAESAKSPFAVGSDLSNAPRVTASFWNRYNIPGGYFKGLGAGLGIINNGSTWSGDPTTTFYFRVPGWTRFDGDLYFKWKRYEIGLDCRNLFDRTYILIPQSSIQLFPGEARKVTLTMTAHF